MITIIPHKNQEQEYEVTFFEIQYRPDFKLIPDYFEKLSQEQIKIEYTKHLLESIRGI